MLHRGTWHWGPFPIEADEVRLFNVQGLRYAEDNRCVDLAAKGLSVDVDLVVRPVSGCGVRTWSLTRPKKRRSSPATVADLVEAITAQPQSGPTPGQRGPSRTTSPDWWVGGRTFGGMVVAQALNAALQTVPPGLEVHSLHGYFLRPTRPGRARTIHGVEPIRDGRSFSSRAGDERRWRARRPSA